MIAPLLHAKSPVAPTTPATATRKAIPEWQLRKIQRELDLCRRLMHASREAARRSERDRKSTMPLFATRGGAPRGARRKPDICRPSAGAPPAFREHSDDRVR
jgi:hypothetical protein